jgi:hypothetical protein
MPHLGAQILSQTDHHGILDLQLEHIRNHIIGVDDHVFDDGMPVLVLVFDTRDGDVFDLFEEELVGEIIVLFT